MSLTATLLELLSKVYIKVNVLKAPIQIHEISLVTEVWTQTSEKIV